MPGTKPAKYTESGAAYREARQRTDLSQRKLGEAVGVDRRYIIKIEQGDVRPRIRLRDRIAETLGVGPSALPAFEEARQQQRPFAKKTSGTGS